MKKFIVAVIFILALWTLGFIVVDLSLAWNQPIATTQEGCRVHVWGINFWPEGITSGKMHWPPFCYSVTWGDHSLNSDEWYKAHPGIISSPCNGKIYVNEVSFAKDKP